MPEIRELGIQVNGNSGNRKSDKCEFGNMRIQGNENSWEIGKMRIREN